MQVMTAAMSKSRQSIILHQHGNLGAGTMGKYSTEGGVIAKLLCHKRIGDFKSVAPEHINDCRTRELLFSGGFRMIIKIFYKLACFCRAALDCCIDFFCLCHFVPLLVMSDFCQKSTGS